LLIKTITVVLKTKLWFEAKEPYAPNMNAFNKIVMTGQLLDKTSIELNSRRVCIPLEFNSVITPYCLPAFKILLTKYRAVPLKTQS